MILDKEVSYNNSLNIKDCKPSRYLFSLVYLVTAHALEGAVKSLFLSITVNKLISERRSLMWGDNNVGRSTEFR